MSFLYLKDGKVSISEEGRLLKIVKALYSSDKTRGKVFFDRCITYIYFVYSSQSIYNTKFLSFRKELVCGNHIKGYKSEDFESNSRVRDLIEFYNSFLTPSEQLYEGCKDDMDTLLIYLKKVPFMRIVKIKETKKDEEENYVTIEYEKEIDNFEEKQKAIKAAESLINLEEKLRLLVFKEQRQKKEQEGKKLFEDLET